jgi:hypothetical protein
VPLLAVVLLIQSILQLELVGLLLVLAIQIAQMVFTTLLLVVLQTQEHLQAQ